jgi:hypothetical protein
MEIICYGRPSCINSHGIRHTKIPFSWELCLDFYLAITKHERWSSPESCRSSISHFARQINATEHTYLGCGTLNITKDGIHTPVPPNVLKLCYVWLLSLLFTPISKASKSPRNSLGQNHILPILKVRAPAMCKIKKNSLYGLCGYHMDGHTILQVVLIEKISWASP